MASLANPFDLLVGGKETSAHATQKKKKGRKAKDQDAGAPKISGSGSVQPTGKVDASEKLVRVSESRLPSAFEEDEGNTWEIVESGRAPGQRSNGGSQTTVNEADVLASKASSPDDALPLPAVALDDITQVDALVQWAAHDDARRLQLLQQWSSRLAAGTAGGRAKKSAGAFAQALLGSSALQTLLQSCTLHPLPPAHRPNLQVFLATLLPSPKGATTLATAMMELGELAQVARRNPKVAAQISTTLSAISTAVLQTSPSGGGASHGLSVAHLQADLADLSLQASQQEHRLIQLEASGDSASALSNRARCSEKLVELSGRRLRLLLGSAAGSPVAALEQVQALGAALKQLPAAARGAAPRGAAVASQDVASSGGGLPALLVQLQVEAAVVAEQLAAAELTVLQLRSRAAQLQAQEEEARSKLAQGQEGGPQVAVAVPAAEERGVAGADVALLKCVEGWAASSCVLEGDVRDAVVGALAEHLQALAAHLHHQRQQQLEVRQRMRFARDKLAPLEQEKRSLLERGKGQLAEQLRLPLEAYQRMVKERTSEATALLKSAEAALQTLQAPVVRVGLAVAGEALSPLVAQITMVAGQMQSDHELILSGVEEPGSVTAPVPVAAAAVEDSASRPPANGRAGATEERNGGAAARHRGGRGKPPPQALSKDPEHGQPQSSTSAGSAAKVAQPVVPTPVAPVAPVKVEPAPRPLAPARGWGPVARPVPESAPVQEGGFVEQAAPTPAEAAAVESQGRRVQAGTNNKK